MSHRLFLSIGVAILAGFPAGAANTVIIEHAGAEAGPGFRFARVQPPRRADAGAGAVFTLLDGGRDPNGGDLKVLNDGLVPAQEDQPEANFFFAAGTAGGRIRADLGAVKSIAAVVTYSWHPGGRGPQVHTLYGSPGTNAGFEAAPARPVDPAMAGWQQIARVDTQVGGGETGGQYAVCVTNAGAGLGHFRYLLWDIEPTDSKDRFGNTFHSELDVLVFNPAPEPPEPAGRPVVRRTVAVEGGVEVVIDTSDVPELTGWSDSHLAPMVQEWYPKISALLASEGFAAPRRVSIGIRGDMRGVAATSGTRITCSAAWMRRELQGEAAGAVFHELVHVVQQYGRARRSQPAPAPTPGWVVEGIPDYLRWYLFEPESKGAEIAPRNAERARYDASYRVSANFLNWVFSRHGRDILTKLNAAAREGRYRDDLWTGWTGQTLPALADQWKGSLATPSPSTPGR